MPGNAEPLLERFRNSVLHIEPSPRRIRNVYAGVTIADTRRAVVLRSVGARRGTPVYYVPAEDVRLDLLRARGEMLDDQHLGQSAYYDLVVGDRVAQNAAWRFEAPDGGGGPLVEGAPDLRGYVAFRWGKLDAWFEEDEEVIQHARDPYVRIDCLPSTRHVRVVVDGETVAETTRPVLLFETGLITRYYIPKLDVRMDLLRPGSGSTTLCPYKGQAHYYSLEINGRVHEDLAWYYPEATRQAARVAGSYVSFFEEQVDYIEVDGVRGSRPASHFAREAY